MPAFNARGERGWPAGRWTARRVPHGERAPHRLGRPRQSPAEPGRPRWTGQTGSEPQLRPGRQGLPYVPVALLSPTHLLRGESKPSPEGEAGERKSVAEQRGGGHRSQERLRYVNNKSSTKPVAPRTRARGAAAAREPHARPPASRRFSRPMRRSHGSVRGTAGWRAPPGPAPVRMSPAPGFSRA